MKSLSSTSSSPFIRILGWCLLMGFGHGSLLWAAEVDQGFPISPPVEAVHVDLFTGTASTKIAIEVPPGRGEVQPDLALTYNSSNGNGWVGVGWKLEQGVIERQTKSGLDYSGDEYVVRLAGLNAELVNIGGEYRAKVEGGFNRFQQLIGSDGKGYWKVTDKTGKAFIFGATAATRLADPNNSAAIFRWCLDRVEDTHGNYMTLSYSGDQGQGYLSRIDYTGNDSLTPTNAIKFYLEDRPDPSSMYIANFGITTAKRLKTIEVTANGNVIRAYSLSYSIGGDASRSILQSIQQFGSNITINPANGIITGVTTLPPITFGWQSGSLMIDQTFLSINENDIDMQYTLEGQNAAELGTGDFNGDGIQDVYFWQSSTGKNRLFLNQGNGTFGPPITPISPSFLNVDQVGGAKVTNRIIADFNGDGISDVLFWWFTTGRNYLFLGTGDGNFGAALTPFSNQAVQNNASNGNNVDWNAGDFDDNGMTDIMFWWPSSGKNVVYLSQGNGTFGLPLSSISSGTIGGGNSWQARRWTAGDFNGDGVTDVTFWWPDTGQNLVFLNQGNGIFGSALNSISPGFLTTGDSAWNEGKWRGEDFNGDGVRDLMFWWPYSGQNRLFLNQGNGTFGPALTPISPESIKDNPPSAHNIQWTGGDFNGDGLGDIYFWWLTSGQNELYLATGQGSFTSSLSPITAGSINGGFFTTQFIINDFNGDSISDAYYFNQAVERNRLFLNISSAPILLTSVSNGLGGISTIDYTPSTIYTNTLLPYPVQTVSQITSSDGNGNVGVTTYDYANGYHHIGEREFRGFNYVKVTSPAGGTGEQTITETWFHQGNDTGVDVNNPNVPDGYLKGAPYRSKITDGAGNPYSETTTSYHADANGQAPFFTPPSSIETSICDGTGCGKQTRTKFFYDGYGNKIREEQFGDTSTSDDDRTVTRDFFPNTTAWIVGLPAIEKVFQGIGTVNQAARTDFYYDGSPTCTTPSTNQTPTKGDLTRVVQWTGGDPPDRYMAYNGYGNLICTRDPRGNITHLTYDSSQTFPVTIINPLVHTTNTAYYGVNGAAMDKGLYGQIKSVTDPNGAVTTMEYDIYGRRTKVIQPNNFYTQYLYVGFGTVGSQYVWTLPQNLLWTKTYFDGLGRTIKTTQAGANEGGVNVVVSETEYDHRGGITRQSLPYFEAGGTQQWTTFEYDPLGRTTKVTNPDTSRQLICYDDWVTVTIDAENHRRRTVRDAYGQPLTVQEYDGTHSSCNTSEGTPYATTRYTYHVMGNLKTVTDEKNNKTVLTYDPIGRKLAMHDPDMGNQIYDYDAASNLMYQRDNKNQHIYFQYDALHRLVQKDYGTAKPVGSGDVQYLYDGTTDFRKGRLRQVLDVAGSTTFYYNAMGQVVRTDKVVDGITYTIQTTYDGLGRVVNLTYPDGSVVTHTYNGPHLSQVKEGSTVYAAYAGFNALGQPGTLTLGNSVVTTYTYKVNNFRLETLKTMKDAQTLQHFIYNFDKVGNTKSIADQLNSQTFVFSYDAFDRLKSALMTNGYGLVTYGYDEIGNMTNNSRIGPYTYPPSGILGGTHPHAVTGAGGNTYTYDANGNMTSGGGRTLLTYDHENRPLLIINNGTVTAFQYDGDGGRVKKTVGGQTTVYIGDLAVCVSPFSPMNCAKLIFAGNQRIALKQASPPHGNGTISYFSPDHLGSTSVLTNGSGVKEQELTYYPYGETHTTSGSANVAYKYTGQELDASTGLYFYQSRYYDAVLGRFISPDTMVPDPEDPQAFNRYSYVRNNPLRYTDPSGHYYVNELYSANFMSLPEMASSITDIRSSFNDGGRFATSLPQPIFTPSLGLELDHSPVTQVVEQIFGNNEGVDTLDEVVVTDSHIPPWEVFQRNSYLYGNTFSINFPIPTAAQEAIPPAGCCDATDAVGAPLKGIKAGIGILGIIGGSKIVGKSAITTFANKEAARKALTGDLGKAANRFFKDAGNKGKDFKITELPDGTFRFEFFKSARTPGFGKHHVQEVYGNGTIRLEYKQTFEPGGKPVNPKQFIHGAE